MTQPIILLTPPLALMDRMGAFSEGGAVMPGLGILYIASYLRRSGHDVRIIDAEGLNLDIAATVDTVCNLNPIVLGISSTTLGITASAEVAAAVKERRPDILVYVGGPHVTALPQETMQSFPQFDGCVLGDGETSFGRMMDNLAAGRPLEEGVDGLIFRKEEEIRHLAKKNHLADLDTLPLPAWDILPGFPRIYRPTFHSYRRLPVANIVTARGCPGVCSFCDRSVFGQTPYFHSIDYVVDMIERLVKDFGIREISIKDDMFVMSPERVSAFCEEIISRKIDVTWSCNARVNYVSEAMLKVMRRAGCWMVSYGIESGSAQMLKKMMKGISLEQIKKALTWTRKNGIVSKGFYMIGIPGETLDTLNASLESLGTLPLDEISVNFYTPFPGSKLYGEVLNEGFIPDFQAMNMQNVVYVPKDLTVSQLRNYQRKMIRSFYLRPKKMALYAGRAVTDFGELKRVWRMGKMFFSAMKSMYINRKEHP
ncbi:MAG: cobalamin-dependent protein [Deltaproteobacteria bacterium]|nr:cobalamin-dependent protein [Deltaproteobacteria bacterium]